MSVDQEKFIPATKVSINKSDYSFIFEDLQKCFSGGRLTLGEYTQRFERALSSELASQSVVAVSSGTGALEIVGMSLELSGGEVIVPSNTFVATAVAFTRIGCRVRFADCDPVYGAITLAEVKRLHSSNTRAVVIVHIGGIVAPESLLIRDYCATHGLNLIEDAAHALGASMDGLPAGTIGDVGTFSFYPTKVVTSGEGGAITTKADAIHQECLIYRDQGKKDFNTNVHIRQGSNWRLSEVHAVIGYYQVKRLNEFVRARERVVDAYYKQLDCDKLRIVVPPANSTSNWYKAIAILDDGMDREQLKSRLASKGVRCGGEVYQLPCHQQPIFQDNLPNYTLTNTENFAMYHFCLPVSAVMNDLDIEYVCQTVKAELQRL